MTVFRFAMAFAAAFVSAAALAAAPSGMKPGQWEYTMSMEMPGMPVAMPPTTYKHCLTQADLDQGEQYKAGDKSGNCEIKNMQQRSDGASYDVACKDGTTGHYDLAVSDNSMQGKGVMKMQGQQMTMNFSSKRIGDCTK